MAQPRDEQKTYLPQSKRLDPSYVEGSADLELIWHVFSNVVGKTLTLVEASNENETKCKQLKKLHEEILYNGRDTILEAIKKNYAQENILKKVK